MKSKFIKSIAVISLILSSLTMAGCGQKTPSPADEENTNVKSEDSTKGESISKGEEKIILLDNDNIKSILSETASNSELEKALIDEFALTDEQAKETRYYYNYVDLNGDGKNEIFAEVVGPYTGGSGGNSAVIFKDNNGVLEEVDDFKFVRNPIIISSNKTNGWNDIICESSGEGTIKKYVVLKYDGEDYSDVEESQTIDSIDDVSGSAIISNDMEYDIKNGKGLYLKK